MSTKLFEITEDPLSLDDAAARVTRPDCGAVVTFAGTVRGETRTDEGERDTDFLVYEAYIPMAEKKAGADRRRNPAALAHRARRLHPAPHWPL